MRERVQDRLLGEVSEGCLREVSPVGRPILFQGNMNLLDFRDDGVDRALTDGLGNPTGAK